MKNFQIKKSKNKKQWHFVLKADNGETILSSEMYNSRQACLNGIEAVKQYSQEYKCFDMRKSKDGKHYFVLQAPNSEIIGVSETYNRKSSMLQGIDSVIRNANSGTPVEIPESTEEE